jgi:hypothetical protein
VVQFEADNEGPDELIGLYGCMHGLTYNLGYREAEFKAAADTVSAN